MDLRKVAAVVLLMFAAESASANQNHTIEDHFRTETIYDPYVEQVCREVISGGDKTGDTVKGAIIGGAIGNAIGKDTEATAAGIILGGLIANGRSNARATSRIVCENETKYKVRSHQVYDHSTITFTHNGRRYSTKFVK